MKRLFGISISAFIVLSFLFVSAHADSNGIWVRAQDIVGGEDVVFGDDFSPEDQKFSFYSENLVIGGPSDTNSLINYRNSNWRTGTDSDQYQIIRGGSDRVSITSDETRIRDEMSLISNSGNAVINIDAPDYAGIDFGDTSNTFWGIGRTMNDDFYISEDGVANRFMINQGGNIGIGTNNPSSKLHVAGDLTVDSISSSTIDDIDSELSSLNTRIGNLENRMDKAEGDISSLDTRMDSAESEISSLQSNVNILEEKVDSNEDRLSSAEKNISSIENQLDSIDGCDVSCSISKSDISGMCTMRGGSRRESCRDNAVDAVTGISCNLNC